jgi:uncharacterized protein YbjQ (UPF0145 family)
MNPWDKTGMVVTTTPSVDGQKIARYHGIVAGEAILGPNMFRDLFAGIRDGLMVSASGTAVTPG